MTALRCWNATVVGGELLEAGELELGVAAEADLERPGEAATGRRRRRAIRPGRDELLEDRRRRALAERDERAGR